MAQLVGVGHNCLDYLCIIESYPPEDGSTHITDIQIQGGGAVATAIAAAARLGIKTAMIGNLGDDEVGDMISAELEREGVCMDAVHRLKGVRSLSSYVMIHPENGTRTKFPYRDRMPEIAWSDHQKQTLKQAQILHLDGTHYKNARTAAQLAKENNVTISLDGCSRQADNRLNRELASMADILIMNAVYPKAVSGMPTLQQSLLEMSKWGPKIVMSTAGANGVFAVINGEIYHYPACKAEVVDTTGAGDVFHGAFLAAYLKGKDLDNCIRFAQYTAARKCEQVGGRTGIPTYDAVERNYKDLSGNACKIKLDSLDS